MLNFVLAIIIIGVIALILNVIFKLVLFAGPLLVFLVILILAFFPSVLFNSWAVFILGLIAFVSFIFAGVFQAMAFLLAAWEKRKNPVIRTNVVWTVLIILTAALNLMLYSSALRMGENSFIAQTTSYGLEDALRMFAGEEASKYLRDILSFIPSQYRPNLLYMRRWTVPFGEELIFTVTLGEKRDGIYLVKPLQEFTLPTQYFSSVPPIRIVIPQSWEPINQLDVASMFVISVIASPFKFVGLDGVNIAKYIFIVNAVLSSVFALSILLLTFKQYVRPK